MALTESQGISAEAYRFIVETVYRHSRIWLGADKQALVTSRLGKRLRQLGLSTFEDYCRLLKADRSRDELNVLLHLISTHHTYFFRESQHLNYLRDRVLPEWVSQPAAARAPFRVWSAACSSGEEPYSIAIVLAEFTQAHHEFAWKIEASDISAPVLERARDAIYPAERITLPQPDLLRRYFQRGVGPYEGQYRVRDALRSRVTFRHLNLLQAQYPVEPNQHVIFCRNVMIYFDQATQQQLVDNLVRQLAPGGLLMVGLSESLLGIRHPLKSLKASVYQKA